MAYVANMHALKLKKYYNVQIFVMDFQYSKQILLNFETFKRIQISKSNVKKFLMRI